MPRLVFIGDHFAGRAVELGNGRTMVGRGSWNGLVIPDKTVSNYHCDLLVHGTEVIVREKGSTNGTWVDEKRVTGQLPVKAGQIVHFGSAQAQLVFDGRERFSDDSTAETGYREYLRFMRAQQVSACQPATARSGAQPSVETAAAPEVPRTRVVQSTPPVPERPLSAHPEPQLAPSGANCWTRLLRLLAGGLLSLAVGLGGVLIMACRNH